MSANQFQDYIDRVVNDAPPLTDTQREAILSAFAGFKPGDDA